MGAAQAQAGRRGAVRPCERRPLPPRHQVRPLAARQAAAGLHFRAAPAGSPAVSALRDPKGAKRPAARCVIVGTSGGHTELDLTRGARLGTAIALGLAALLGAAFAVAWHPEIDKIAPPSAASFDRSLVAQGEDLARLGNCA